MSALLAATVLVPLAITALLVVPRLRPSALALAPWAAAPAVAAALGAGPAGLDAPMLLTGLRIGLDAPGRTFLLFIAALWLTAGVSARAYIASDDPHRLRYWACFLLAQAGNLLLVVALDAASFYVGFAVMTFASYGLVVHAGTPAATYAGRVYLVMAVLAEASLLAGLLLRVDAVGSAVLPMPSTDSPHEALAAVLIFAGFGVKAGVALLHMWLPLAHPVAPTPASAVLSGAMIKAGVLGWMRFLPLGAEAWPTFGPLAMALGLAAMFGAVAFGLMQREAKAMLAYSSVSQMGFLTLAVGAALTAPDAWPMLAAAVVLYAFHHGLAKGALFLAVAAVPAAREGARRAALVAAAIPALALAGAPLTSGALAKTELKAALSGLASPWPALLAWLLPLAAVGTTLLMIRFLYALRTLPAGPHPGLAAPWLASVLLALAGAWFAFPQATETLTGVESWPAAAGPVALGGAIAWILARTIRTAPQGPPGDVLVWLGPIALALWRTLLGAVSWPDRHGSAHAPAARERAWPDRVEGLVRRFATAGALWALLAAAIALAIVR